MGTLTADCPRLDEHCPHKLATSCRLTSTPNCCACADKRQHSQAYRIYVDGVGLVQRGTRWQGYCWFCKEFWTNRLASTEPPIEISQTRVPEIPDQTEFLNRWNEFHQGYRIAKRPDGTEQRIAVIGEPFKEVSPGFLPRTLAQLRLGVVNNASRPENRITRRRLSLEDMQPEEPQEDLDETLDALINEALDEEAPVTQEPTIPQIAELPGSIPSRPSRPLTRGEAQLQRARERFARVFGSREDVQQDNYVSPLTSMYSRAYDRYRQAERRRAEGTTAPPPLDGLSAQERRDVEEQLLWGVMRESQLSSESVEQEGDVWSYAPTQATLEAFEFVEGEDRTTREARFRSMVFDQQRDRYISTRNATPNETTQTTTHRPNRLRRMTPVNSASNTASHSNQTSSTSASSSSSTSHPRTSSPATISLIPPPPRGLTGVRTSIQQINSELRRLRLASEALSSAQHTSPARNNNDQNNHNPDPTSSSSSSNNNSNIHLPIFQRQHQHHHHYHHQSQTPTITLDNQPDRPALSQTDEEMTKILACQICYQQLADIAVLPCGHMIMCQWCADVIIPVRHGHVPVRPSKCPMCRRLVKQRFRIHMGS